MLFEFLTSTESLINVVSWCKVLQTAKHGLIKADLCSLDVILSVRSGQHGIDFVEPKRKERRIFVSKVTELARHLS